MSTLQITRIGVIDASKKLHHDFTHRYLDHKRHTECEVVYALFKEGNLALASIMSNTVDRIINEQMHLKLRY